MTEVTADFPSGGLSAEEANAVYRDRAHILALLALHYPAYWAYSDAANKDWPVLTLDTPQGQMSWHIAPRDIGLFQHVRRAADDQAAAAYDGHSTEDKHDRIRARIYAFPVMV